MISLAHQADIAILTMAHGKANLFDLEFCDAVASALDQCARSPAKAAVITAGGSIFSGGVDLRRLVEGGQAYAEEFLPALGRAFDVAFAFPKPLVAAVNGHAIAGGCILACAADRRLMARGTGRIGVPELLVGVPFPTVALEIVRLAVPSPHLTMLIYSGETVAADRAVELGLADAAVDPDRLLEEAVNAANAMAALPAAAFAITKNQLRAPARARIREGNARVDPAIREYWAAPGTLATVRDYMHRTLKK
jgi:enoyl-CoA hydratase/carnithine racemase